MSEITLVEVLSCGAAFVCVRVSCSVCGVCGSLFSDGVLCAVESKATALSAWRAPYAHRDPREGGWGGGGTQKRRRGCTTCVRESTVHRFVTVLCTVLCVNSRASWC